ncbi:uncharacterized protein KY384_002671 [Bacidia gigantensis]|uniref:uncharacterized protein n=1 Tax=Bacidia gigantensis TaxID=2732470 RepID=UPI001D04F02E|nr:uncharacterized protein KY384_002671 [Bacidia gigantensis]KAG8532793.1 hypothetical protein KY384_002671 [Bacidia gigantensis]
MLGTPIADDRKSGKVSYPDLKNPGGDFEEGERTTRRLFSADQSSGAGGGRRCLVELKDGARCQERVKGRGACRDPDHQAQREGRCTALKSDGTPCNKFPTPGFVTCKFNGHREQDPAVMAKKPEAQIRPEAGASIGNHTPDPAPSSSGPLEAGERSVQEANKKSSESRQAGSQTKGIKPSHTAPQVSESQPKSTSIQRTKSDPQTPLDKLRVVVKQARRKQDLVERGIILKTESIGGGLTPSEKTYQDPGHRMGAVPVPELSADLTALKLEVHDLAEKQTATVKDLSEIKSKVEKNGTADLTEIKLRLHSLGQEQTTTSQELSKLKSEVESSEGYFTYQAERDGKSFDVEPDRRLKLADEGVKAEKRTDMREYREFQEETKQSLSRLTTQLAEVKMQAATLDSKCENASIGKSKYVKQLEDHISKFRHLPQEFENCRKFADENFEYMIRRFQKLEVIPEPLTKADLFTLRHEGASRIDFEELDTRVQQLETARESEPSNGEMVNWTLSEMREKASIVADSPTTVGMSEGLVPTNFQLQDLQSQLASQASETRKANQVLLTQQADIVKLRGNLRELAVRYTGNKKSVSGDLQDLRRMGNDQATRLFSIQNNSQAFANNTIRQLTSLQDAVSALQGLLPTQAPFPDMHIHSQGSGPQALHGGGERPSGHQTGLNRSTESLDSEGRLEQSSEVQKQRERVKNMQRALSVKYGNVDRPNEDFQEHAG